MNRPPRPPHEGTGPPNAGSRGRSDPRVEYESSSGTRRAPSAEESFFVGRYRVICEIGRGGMASVHLSRIDGPGGFAKWVAIKRIHPHLVENDQLVDMFLDEARMAAGISHPNVAQVFDIGKDKDTYWIAMEYLHGEPVRELLRSAEERGEPVQSEVAARIIADAAEGLHAAHELRGKNGDLLNLVHRDVTPHNLFVTYDGYTKVVDFGIAKAAGRLAQTNAGELKGKIAYMAPEQIKNQDLDRRTDVFALGIVLWELTTNQRLFRMDTDLDTLEKVQACVVPPPSSVVPGYPRHLEEIVLTALAREKEDRYQTARAFSRALQTFLRRNTFVGFEEVGELMKKTFAEKLTRRNDHLAWASEVTGSVQVDGRAAPQSRALATTRAEHDEDDVSTLQDEGSTSTQDFPTDVMKNVGEKPADPPLRALDKAALMEDDDDAATLIARNPSKYLEELANDRKARKSDSTQLLPIEDRDRRASAGDPAGSTGPLPAAGRLPRTEPPPPLVPRSRPPSRPPLSHRVPLPRAPVPSSTSMNGALPPHHQQPPTLAQVAVQGPFAPGATHAMSAAEESSYSPSSRQLLPQPMVPRMFPSEPSTTDPSSPYALRDAPSSSMAGATDPLRGPSTTTEASVPAAAVGFRPPQHADPSITAPRPMAPTDPDVDYNDPRANDSGQVVAPTLFDRERSGNVQVPQVPQVPQAAIETQLSAPRTRVRSTLTVVVIILAVMCSITFVLLLAAIGRTYFGL